MKNINKNCATLNNLKRKYWEIEDEIFKFECELYTIECSYKIIFQKNNGIKN